MSKEYGLRPDLKTTHATLARGKRYQKRVSEEIPSDAAEVEQVLGSFLPDKIEGQLKVDPQPEFNREVYQGVLLSAMLQAGSLYREVQNSLKVADFLNVRIRYLLDKGIPLTEYLVKQGSRKGSEPYKRWNLERYEGVEQGLKKVHTESINSVARAGVINIDQLQHVTYEELVGRSWHKLGMSKHTFEFVQHLLKPLDEI
ncbi:MAG TPA: hypothetical protein VHE53_05045 [Patescibacteria group bacterium]|nr:hypothetical protein [Patescibacteria group bacterium]